MIRPGFLDSESRLDLIELARDGSAAHRLARRANARVLLDDGMSCEAIARAWKHAAAARITRCDRRSRLPDAFDAVLRVPARTPKALAARLDLVPQTATALLRDLREAGLVNEITGRCTEDPHAHEIGRSSGRVVRHSTGARCRYVLPQRLRSTRPRVSEGMV